MNTQQADLAGARPRAQRFLPHLAASLAGGAALWGWGTLIEAGWLESEVGQITYFVGLMISPAVGASAVTYSQRASSGEERNQVLIPYVWWAALGLLALLLLVLTLGGPDTQSDGFVRPVGRIAFWAVFASMWLVPVIVPLLRAIMWLISPPVIRADDPEARSVSSRSTDIG